MKVVEHSKFNIYVYPNDHPPVHCHVRYNDDSDVSVDLPMIVPRYGAKISRETVKTIEDNLDKLINIWEELNKSFKTSIKKKK